jgi:hypothetical protein
MDALDQACAAAGLPTLDEACDAVEAEFLAWHEREREAQRLYLMYVHPWED